MTPHLTKDQTDVTEFQSPELKPTEDEKNKMRQSGARDFVRN
jgi:hypothetical protein